ncbi:MAG: cytochrome b [Halocynthiibacter sp.]
MTKYSKSIIFLHWASAILVIAALLAGNVILANLENADPEKLFSYRAHALIGILVLILTLIRVLKKRSTPKPPQAATGHVVLDKVGVSVHHLLYVLLILVPVSGLALAMASGVGAYAFGGSGIPPMDADSFAAGTAHGIATKLLMGAVGLHILGALYHQFIRKDNLLGRMAFWK